MAPVESGNADEEKAPHFRYAFEGDEKRVIGDEP